MKPIIAGIREYAEVNGEINGRFLSENKITVTDVNGQRYLGCALGKGKTLEIEGTAGNDLAFCLSGGKIILRGNGQDAVGNTMGGGEIVIHGHAGDAAGYGMRDGSIYIRDNVSCRGGIHMKEFKNMKPVLVIGSNAGSFLGEYMAGGTIVLLGLGLKRGEKLFGTHCASGMHAGKMFVRGTFPKENLSPNIKIAELTRQDREELEKYIKKYCGHFGADYDKIMKKPFKKLVPETSRPYANLYTAD
ncbi:MAG: hypothetical protein IJL77_00695 [Clostridia bacterium]|nr:hypothetical protein [Clostridia bacterium]